MTKSLCPVCSKPLDAEVYEEDGKILIKKTCDKHGEFVNTYWSSADLYDRANKYEPTIKSILGTSFFCIHKYKSMPIYIPYFISENWPRKKGAVQMINIIKYIFLLIK